MSGRKLATQRCAGVPISVLFVALVGLVVSNAQAEDSEVALATGAPEASAEPGTLPPMGVMEYLCSQRTDFIDPVSSPVGVYLNRVKRDLRSSSYQWAIAAIALAVGAFCIWNGPKTWQALFTAAMVGAATILARIQAEAWELDLVSELLLMFQVAFAMGAAVQSGFDSLQLLFGAGVGFLGCYSCGGWARSVDAMLPGFALFWYSIGAVLSALVLIVWQEPVLVTLGPLVGGLLVVTGLWCLVGVAVAGAPGPSALPPPHRACMDVASDILFPVGAAALAIHGCCAIVTTLVYKSGSGDERRLRAAVCLVGGILISAAAAGAQGSMWLAGQCAMWAVFSSVYAYDQLGLLQPWTARSLTDVARTFSSAGSLYFKGSFRSAYEPAGSMQDGEAGGSTCV